MTRFLFGSHKLPSILACLTGNPWATNMVVDVDSGFGDGYEGMETEVQLENILEHTVLCFSMIISDDLSSFRLERC